MHQKKCALHSIMEAPQQMLRVHIAGITCKDFSVMNRWARGLEGGASGFPCLVWIFERRWVREQVLIIENVRGFSLQTLLDLLPMYVLGADLTLGPEDIGWWCVRKRRFMVLLLQGWSLQLNGCDALAEFLRVFGKQRPSSGKKGHMFFCAPTQEQIDSKARRRRLAMPVSNDSQQPVSNASQAGGSETAAMTSADTGLAKMSWESTYTEGQVSRLRMYEKAAAEELFHGIVSSTDEGLRSLIRKTLQARVTGWNEGEIVELDSKKLGFASSGVTVESVKFCC